MVTPHDDLIAKAREVNDAAGQRFDLLNAYYDGDQVISMLGLDLPPSMNGLRTAVNWPRLVVDAIAERQVVNGFRVGASEDLDARMWEWWHANNLDEESRLLHVEALVNQRGFIVVGLSDDRQSPLFTVESRRNIYVEVDPRTREVARAVRLYDVDDFGQPKRVTVYERDETSYYVHERHMWRSDGVVRHRLGRVPVVPMTNRSRIDDRLGRSEMSDIIPLADAACRNLTVLQGAQELLALPQTYVFGADAQDFKDAVTGEVAGKWQAYLARLRAMANEKGDVKQVAGADLRNFTEVLNYYGRQVAALSGLPPHFLGMASENPPSADAIRSSESRLVMRVRDRNLAFSGAWEEAMRLAFLWVDGSAPREAERIETVWASPETPTFSAKADAVTKLVQAGIMPPEAALEELGYSEQQRDRWARMRADEPLTLLARNAVQGDDA